MPAASRSVTIQRPIEQVFAFIADGEQCTKWRSGVLDIKRISGQGVGTRYAQGVRGPMGRRIAADLAGATALALPGAAHLDPSGMGRPMKAWVRVPLEHASEWPSLAGAAAEAVRS